MQRQRLHVSPFTRGAVLHSSALALQSLRACARMPCRFDCWRRAGEMPSNMPGCPCPLGLNRVRHLVLRCVLCIECSSSAHTAQQQAHTAQLLAGHSLHSRFGNHTWIESIHGLAIGALLLLHRPLLLPPAHHHQPDCVHNCTDHVRDRRAAGTPGRACEGDGRGALWLDRKSVV